MLFNKKKWLLSKWRLLIIPLIGCCVAYLFSISPVSDHLRLYLYDFCMQNTHAETTDDPVIIIGIDDLTLKRFKDPLVLWHKYIAAVIRGAADAGAKGLAIDMVFAISLSDLAPNLDRELIQSLQYAKTKSMPVYLGFSAGKNRLMPHEKFLFFSSGIGFLNLYPDRDGKIRRQILFQKGKKGRKVYSIARLLTLSADLPDTSALPNPLYIDFRKPIGPILPFSEFYGAITANSLQFKPRLHNKFVILGITTPKLQDIHITPFKGKFGNSAYIPGVFIHALTAKTILQGRPLVESPAWIVWSLSAFIGLMVGVLVLLISPYHSILLVSILALAVFSGTYVAFMQRQVFNAAPFFSFLFINSAVSGGYRTVVEHSQFRRLRKYFKSYVNPQVMQEIIEHPEKVSFDGQQMVLTVMFTDIRNFTTISEYASPKELVAGLNRYFTAMTAAVTEFDGYLNRYLGDGILALFGAPNQLEADGAWAAVQCGFKMLDYLDRMNTSNIFPGVERVNIGIGIHTGEAVVGNIGCYEKMDYSIIGDTANLASRIESQTKAQHVPMLISEATHERIKERVKSRFVGSAKVKGRSQEVKLYEVVALKV